MLSSLPHAKFMVTTLGAKGAVLLSRSGEPVLEASGVVLQDYLEETFQQISKQLPELDSAPVDAIGCGNVPIRSGIQIPSLSPMVLKMKRDVSDAAAAQRAAVVAAQKAARNNADSGNHEGYVGSASFEHHGEGLTASVTVVSAAVVDKDAIYDTTGAGDAFIGTLLYGLVTKMSHVKTLRLACLVSAANCTALGARLGLPDRDNLRPEVL
uniref:PfkB-type carbohydrate kinase n=1 Tax=Tetraselmis sp. GSL018 TaxID=582737 RepID=A0A061RCN6_9CHLO